MKKVVIVASLFLVVAFFFGWKDVEMGRKLEPLRDTFTVAAAEGYRIIYSDNGEGKLADYGGKLDRIIAKRDSMLDANGYVLVGYWKSHNGSPIFLSFYVYTGGLF